MSKKSSKGTVTKPGIPKAVPLNVRDDGRLVAPEPEILKILGEHSKRVGTDRLTSRQIDAVIKAARAQKRTHIVD